MDRLAIKAPRACAAIVEFIVGDLSANPARVGILLRGELIGLWRAVRGPYRIIYDFDETEVRIVHIDHRADVYRPQ